VGEDLPPCLGRDPITPDLFVSEVASGEPEGDQGLAGIAASSL
jgi:hypothetical protein